MDSCKILNAMSYVCTQNPTFLSSHLHENVWLNCCNPEEGVINVWLKFNIPFGHSTQRMDLFCPHKWRYHNTLYG